MTRKELYEWIDGLEQDIEFEYKGKYGSICPFSREEIAIFYDGKSESASSVENAMEIPFIDGLALNDICGKIVFW